MTLRRVAITLIALQCLALTGLPQSNAATAKPKPHPTTKVTSTTTKKKPIAKPKLTAKPKLATKPKLAKKPTTTKKKVVPKKKTVTPHYVYRKRVRKPVPPSPSPSWPPKGFTSFGTAYARIPTGTELIGILSAAKKPAAGINSCAADPKHPANPPHSCAAILVASSKKCTWWKISSTITGIDPADSSARISLGDITTYVVGAAAKKIQTIFLVSPLPLETGVKFTEIHATCGVGPSTDPVPSTTFEPAPTPIASPTESTTPTATDTPTPAPTP